MKINTQPLKNYVPLPELSIKENTKKARLAKKGDLIAIGVNKQLWYQAILVANELEINIECILEYIASQIPLKPKSLKFEPITDSKKLEIEFEKDLTSNLQRYGKTIKGSILEKFMYLEIGLHVTKCEDVLNAILSQLILNHKVELYIDNSPESKKQWNIPVWSETLSDAPNLKPTKTITNINEIK